MVNDPTRSKLYELVEELRETLTADTDADMLHIGDVYDNKLEV